MLAPAAWASSKHLGCLEHPSLPRLPRELLSQLVCHLCSTFPDAPGRRQALSLLHSMLSINLSPASTWDGMVRARAGMLVPPGGLGGLNEIVCQWGLVRGLVRSTA